MTSYFHNNALFKNLQLLSTVAPYSGLRFDLY